MKRFSIKPYGAFESWGDYNTLKEARHARCKLAMSFFSRRVVIIDNKTGKQIK